ncbi:MULTISPECIES: AraC family transcriptional regulator [unclassified Siphonobacter]|uniref:AraC family transcriptional regulator n=1 Tax=unclassified Siphonobacter TaxID=2635712 RepID=UPI0027834016|nr:MULTISPECIES: AraC family transcriptional regulator [unclassified Siphonobacter]MDQ1085490.1 AraC family transcriptional activator of pobA [Siphonobacter sp. SORGH_AS_1065]MDR6197303.1 AraC family transcriptional activator of pobA [Siphonobacter sp. SORGH_AS_0500]
MDYFRIVLHYWQNIPSELRAIKLKNIAESRLSNTLVYMRNLHNCPPSYLEDPSRKDFFEIVWLKNEDPLHDIRSSDIQVKGDWVYLIPPYRVHQLNKAGKSGELLSFKREVISEEDKEFLLDIFKIFNVQGEFSCLKLEEPIARELTAVFQLMKDEYQKEAADLMILKAILRVFLLKLIKVKEQEFTNHDIHQKRVFDFFTLLESNYLHVRNTDFYAGKLGLSSKRLNQILKDKLDKTGMQLIHDRIILEAKRLIIHSDCTIKEISFQLGFSDRPYFSRFFKKQTGQTPEQFQKQSQSHLIQKRNTLSDDSTI